MNKGITDGHEKGLTEKQLLTFHLDVSATIAGAEFNTLLKLNTTHQLERELSGMALMIGSIIPKQSNERSTCNTSFTMTTQKSVVGRKSEARKHPPSAPQIWQSVIGSAGVSSSHLFFKSRGRGSSNKEIESCKKAS